MIILNWLKMIKKLIRKLIPNKFVNNLNIKLGVPSQRSSLVNLKKLGFSPINVLDVGAYEGHWASEMKSIFPDTKILMIEGQETKRSILLEKSKFIKDSSVAIALLGAEEKEVEFNIYETARSVYKEDNETTAKTKTIKLALLDDVVSNSSFNNNIDFIKLDTQGYELQILKGASKVLQSVQMVLMEVSLLGIYKDAPLAQDVIAYMKSKGFVLYDICSLMRRPYDNALFQADFLFIKEDHILRASTRWS
jgi:FkbM family methyltransferase